MPKGFGLTDDIDECDIFISVMYGELISEEFIQSKVACFNFHPGILPFYRGSGAFSWALINQDSHAGVTLHKIDVGIDDGDIIDRQAFRIRQKDTAHTLYINGTEIMFMMFKDWFEKLLTGDYETIEHIESSRVYYRKDLENAKDITRFIRAFTFPGKESAYYYDNDGNKVHIEYGDN